MYKGSVRSKKRECSLVAVVVDCSSTRAGFHHDEVTLVLLVLNSLSNYIQSYAHIIPAANWFRTELCLQVYPCSFVSMSPSRFRYLDRNSVCSVSLFSSLSFPKRHSTCVYMSVCMYVCICLLVCVCVCVSQEKIRRTVPKIDMRIVADSVTNL